MGPITAGHWLLATWRLSSPGSDEFAHLSADIVRDGCVQGRYWLRAYAALPDRLALLLYPLEAPEDLLAHFSAFAGRPPAKYRAIVSDAELERAACYVESLPVRSHLARRADEYPWSSAGWIHAIEH